MKQLRGTKPLVSTSRYAPASGAGQGLSACPKRRARAGLVERASPPRIVLAQAVDPAPGGVSPQHLTPPLRLQLLLHQPHGQLHGTLAKNGKLRVEFCRMLRCLAVPIYLSPFCEAGMSEGRGQCNVYLNRWAPWIQQDVMAFFQRAAHACRSMQRHGDDRFVRREAPKRSVTWVSSDPGTQQKEGTVTCRAPPNCPVCRSSARVIHRGTQAPVPVPPETQTSSSLAARSPLAHRCWHWACCATTLHLEFGISVSLSRASSPEKPSRAEKRLRPRLLPASGPPPKAPSCPCWRPAGPGTPGDSPCECEPRRRSELRRDCGAAVHCAPGHGGPEVLLRRGAENPEP